MKNSLFTFLRVFKIIFLCSSLLFVSYSFAGELEDLIAKANHGDANAQNNLGVMYAEGQGVPQNYEQAAIWFTKAANQGITGAQFNLGLMYSEGLGVPKDDKQAAVLFTKVANTGHADTQFGLALMYAEGRGVIRNYRQAFIWASLAATGGNKDASIFRDHIKSKLTPEALAEAQRQTKELAEQIEANKTK